MSVKEKKHVNYSDIVTAIADGSWGQDYESQREAEKEMLGDKQMLTAIAAIELIKRLNAIGKACGSQRVNHKEWSIEPFGDEPSFPTKEVGDRLYSGDLEDGISEYIIIAKDENHRCMVVGLHDFDLKWPPEIHLATKCHKETMTDAVKHAAKIDIEYHGEKFELAKGALQAASNGQDLSRFLHKPASDGDSDV